MQAYYEYNSSRNYAAIVQCNGVNKLKDLFSGSVFYSNLNVCFCVSPCVRALQGVCIQV